MARKPNDRRDDYLDWCKRWISQCVRLLKPGGSFFTYNLPKWNIPIGNYLEECGLTFRHWIAVEIARVCRFLGDSTLLTIVCFITAKASRRLSAEFGRRSPFVGTIRKEVIRRPSRCNESERGQSQRRVD